MATRSQLLARIVKEVDILSDVLLAEEQQVRTYRITHRRIVGVNSIGGTIELWVYRESEAEEEALLSYADWKDVPLANRYLDYISTLLDHEETGSEIYHTLSMMSFTLLDSQAETSVQKIGIWNNSTNKLDVYDQQSASIPDPGPGDDKVLAMSQGIRDNQIAFDPRNGKNNARQVPLFEVIGMEYPAGIGFIDVAAEQIVLPANMPIARVDITVSISTRDTTNNDGTNFHFQWKRNGDWVGAVLSTGFIKQEAHSFLYVANSYIKNDNDGSEDRFDFWAWTTDRQGPIDINDCSCLVEERKVNVEDLYVNPVFGWGIIDEQT